MSLKQSTVVIYKSTGILPEKNFIIDDIEDYLTSFTSTTISNVQYFKHALDTFVKLDYSQELQEFLASNDYNYMSITNDDGKTCYYFIIGKAVLGQSTIQFRLRMDTCNTFLPGTDFTINDKTKIKRQHRDRFARTSSSTLVSGVSVLYPSNYDEDKQMYYDTYSVQSDYMKTYICRADVAFTDTSIQRDREIEYSIDTSTGTLTITVWDERSGESDDFSYFVRGATQIRRVIDTYHEGLNPVLYKQSSTPIVNSVTDLANVSWNLIYKTNDTALDCYLLPDNELDLSIGDITFTITADDLPDDDYIYILSKWIPTAKFQYQPSNFGIKLMHHHDALPQYIRLKKNGQSISWQEGTIIAESVTYAGGASGISTSISFYYPPLYLFYYQTESELTYQEILDQDSYTAYYTTTGQTTSYTISAFSVLDRTESTLVKIIKLPYCPTQIDENGVLDSSWSIDTSLITGANSLKLRNTNQKFSTSISNSVESPFSPFFVDTVPLLTDTRSISNESKLYHSDYYQPKLVYDSFNYTFRLDKEDIDKLNLIYTGSLQLDFIMTSTINSRFAFMMPEVAYSYSTEDFDNVLNIARNNEVVLYTSAYLDYIRTGYNYDVKTKQRSEIGTIASAVGSIITFGVGIATGNAAAIVSGGVALTTAIIQGANSIAQAEANIEQRLAQTKAQAWSVAGADDIDLLESYSGNYAYLNIYSLSDRLKNALYDVFFYTGYATDEQGIPDMTSRYRFNFVACDLVVTGNNNIPDDIDSDLKARYSEGVTFIHNLDGVWDTEQEYENWETSLGGDS